jgi:ribosomal protein S30
MSSATQRQNDSNLVSEQIAPSPSKSPVTPSADTQVKSKRPYAPRRRFDAAYKQRILTAYNACTNAMERGALLRREGLYHARIAAWRQDLTKGKLNEEQRTSAKLRTDHLVREVAQLKKKLAQAEAIIDLQKKVSELLATHILPHENNE